MLRNAHNNRHRGDYGAITFRDWTPVAAEEYGYVAADPLKRKQLDAGLRQLTEEGAAQVFYTSGTDTLSPTPIVGAVGLLQFDVMLHRLEHEYGAPCRLEKITARYPRWVVGSKDDVERIARDRGRLLLYDAKGHPLILFEDAWGLRWVLEAYRNGKLP